MSTIDPAARLAALMRAQAGSLRRSQPAARSAAGKPPGGEADAAALLALRLKAVAPDDPRREHKAARIYLESVLLAELGPGLANDPAFAVMVDDILGQMNSDPQLARALADAAALLLAQARS